MIIRANILNLFEASTTFFTSQQVGYQQVVAWSTNTYSRLQEVGAELAQLAAVPAVASTASGASTGSWQESVAGMVQQMLSTPGALWTLGWLVVMVAALVWAQERLEQAKAQRKARQQPQQQEQGMFGAIFR